MQRDTQRLCTTNQLRSLSPLDDVVVHSFSFLLDHLHKNFLNAVKKIPICDESCEVS